MATGGVPEISKGPSTIYWYLTNTCNQRCAHCWVTAGAEFGQRALRLAELREFFDDAIASGLPDGSISVCSFGISEATRSISVTPDPTASVTSGSRAKE